MSVIVSNQVSSFTFPSISPHTEMHYQIACYQTAKHHLAEIIYVDGSKAVWDALRLDTDVDDELDAAS
ncbi:kiwellin [Sesbania bispinosa]|nr:kiwellin [Sesbania bispinosa]